MSGSFLFLSLCLFADVMLQVGRMHLVIEAWLSLPYMVLICYSWAGMSFNYELAGARCQFLDLLAFMNTHTSTIKSKFYAAFMSLEQVF